MVNSGVRGEWMREVEVIVAEAVKNKSDKGEVGALVREMRDEVLELINS